MNIERDKFLTEAMGEVWYADWVQTGDSEGCGYYCYKNDFSTWEGFGKLWNFMKFKQPFWSDCCEDLQCYIGEYVNPDNFANYVYKYLKEK